MRETGPVNKELTGDQDQSVAYIQIARTQLGILKNLMKLGNLPAGARNITLDDGTTMRVTSINGTDSIHIDTVPAAPPAEPPPDEPFEPPVAEIPEPELPDYVPPVIAGFSLCGGQIRDFTGFPEKPSFVPYRINGVEWDAVDGRPFPLAQNPTYGFVDVAGFVRPNTMLLGYVDPSGAEIPDRQGRTLSDFTYIGNPGFDLTSTCIVPNTSLVAAGTDSLPHKGLATILMLGVCKKTTFTLTMKGKTGPKSEGKFTIERSISPRFSGFTGVGVDQGTVNGIPMGGNGPRQNITSFAACQQSLSYGPLGPSNQTAIFTFQWEQITGNNGAAGSQFSNVTYSGAWALDWLGGGGSLTSPAFSSFGTYSDSGVLTLTDQTGNVQVVNVSFLFNATP